MKDESKKHRESFDHAWSKMIAHAWRDPKFKERLLKEPLKVFEEHGIELPSGTECKVHENTKKVIHFCLPEKPEGEISEEKLKNVSGGFCSSLQ